MCQRSSIGSYSTHLWSKELKEVIFVNRDIQYVDGFSGKSEDERDYIYLTRYLTSPLEIVLRPKTVIYAFQLNSFLNIPIPVINYKLNRQNGNLSLFIRSEEPIQHRFKIEFSLQALDRIIFLDNEMYFIFRNENSFFNLHISDWFGTIQLSVIRCFFESQHVLRLVNTNSLYIQEFGVYAIDSLKEFYSHFSAAFTDDITRFCGVSQKNATGRLCGSTGYPL